MTEPWGNGVCNIIGVSGFQLGESNSIVLWEIRLIKIMCSPWEIATIFAILVLWI